MDRIAHCFSQTSWIRAKGLSIKGTPTHSLCCIGAYHIVQIWLGWNGRCVSQMPIEIDGWERSLICFYTSRWFWRWENWVRSHAFNFCCFWESLPFHSSLATYISFWYVAPLFGYSSRCKSYFLIPHDGMRFSLCSKYQLLLRVSTGTDEIGMTNFDTH